MKPLDPRLLTYARAARRWIIITAVLGLLQAAAVIGQSLAISGAISPVISAGATRAQVAPAIWALVGVLVVRAGLVWARTALGHRAAHEAISQLRQRILVHAQQLGPRWQARRGADTATLVTRGLSDLEPYFVDYLPQLMLSVTVTPLTLAVMLLLDWFSALTALITIPLIPLFMILIGKLTQDFSRRRLRTMQRLGRQLLDLISGLATLKIIGREKGPERDIAARGATYTATTMATLRVAFLSGAVLEFISVLSVALVAVEVGMRLVFGHIDLFTGLVVIMLAPEVYAPIRDVGKQFHASTNGVAAAQAAFAIIEQPLPPTGTHPAPDLAREVISCAGVSHPSRGVWAPHNLDGQACPGQLVALVGRSGAGKTTAAMMLLKQLPCARGRISVGGLDLAEIENTSWWRQVAWLPQRPVLLPGTIADNVCTPADASPADTDAGTPAHDQAGAAGRDAEAIPQAVRAAAEVTGFGEVVRALPGGWQARIGAGGVGLSVGQRQRLALTRLLADPRQLVVMDEPTAHLDAALEAQVIAAIEALLDQGKTVIVIAHRPTLIARADVVWNVEAGGRSDSRGEESDEDAHAAGLDEDAHAPGVLELMDREQQR